MDKDAVYYCKAQWTKNQSPSVWMPSTEAGIEGVMGSRCSVAGPPLLLHGCQQRGLWRAARLQRPRQHLPSVVQTQGNAVTCRNDGSKLSVLSMGHESTGTAMATREEPETEGAGRAASRPSLEGICWLESKDDKCNKEGEWEQEESLGDEIRSRKWKSLIAIQVQFDFCAFCPYEYFLINSGDINYPTCTTPKIRSWISPAMKVLKLTLSASQRQR